MQNYKKYGIPKAQLVIADVPYNLGNNMYGSNPMWYAGGDNKNGESKLAGKAAFNSDFNFNLYEYFHFCSKMLKKEPKEKGKAPCMIVFCSFQQIPTMLKAAKKHGFGNSIHLTFCKNYSAQVLKANMRVVGATEHALVLHKGLPEADKVIWLGTEHGLIFYRDKNDALIWENDIVVYYDMTEERYLISWESNKACYEYQQYGCSMMNFNELSGCEIEVLGNIFDNPGLLEVQS